MNMIISLVARAVVQGSMGSNPTSAIFFSLSQFFFPPSLDTEWNAGLWNAEFHLGASPPNIPASPPNLNSIVPMYIIPPNSLSFPPQDYPNYQILDETLNRLPKLLSIFFWLLHW